MSLLPLTLAARAMPHAKNGLKFLVAAKPTTLVEASCVPLSVNGLQKRAKTVQTSMAVYVGWAIGFKSEVRSDLRGCLEVIVASNIIFFVFLLLIETLNLLTMDQFLKKIFRNTPQNPHKPTKVKFSFSLMPAATLLNPNLVLSRKGKRNAPFENVLRYEKPPRQLQLVALL